MLTICTFNIKNNYKDYNKEKSKEIISLLNKFNIDILSLQEEFIKCRKDIEKEITNTAYKRYGSMRYKLKLFNSINEATSIITKLNVLNNKTYHLPYLPSLLKRIVTRVVIEIGNTKLVIFNTHLDYKYNFVKKRQLKRIYKLLKKETLPIILMGDFNLKNNNQIFNDFTDSLKELGLKRVPIKEKTLKQSQYKRAIDHIFIPRDCKVIDYKVIKDLEISDHYPIIVKLEFTKN